MKPSGLTYGLALCGLMGAWQDSLFYFFLGVPTYFVHTIAWALNAWNKNTVEESHAPIPLLKLAPPTSPFPACLHRQPLPA